MNTTPHAPAEGFLCTSCGMSVSPSEFHPYAACLMFMACHDGSTVRANLEALRAAGVDKYHEWFTSQSDEDWKVLFAHFPKLKVRVAAVLNATPSPSEPAQGEDLLRKARDLYLASLKDSDTMHCNRYQLAWSELTVAQRDEWIAKAETPRFPPRLQHAIDQINKPQPPAQGDVEAVMAEVEAESGRASDFTWDAPVIWIETVRAILLRQLGKGGV